MGEQARGELVEVTETAQTCPQRCQPALSHPESDLSAPPPPRHQRCTAAPAAAKPAVTANTVTRDLELGDFNKGAIQLWKGPLGVTR